MRTQVGSLNGTKYILLYQQLCEEMAVDSKDWAWFLFIGDSAHPDNFSGIYETKSEALNVVATQGIGEDSETKNSFV